MTPQAELSIQSHWTIPLRTSALTLGARTAVMGIVNVTPDSFSDGGQHASCAQAVTHALELAEAGADLIDIGGESTRPGATRVSADEECARVLPVIRALRERVRIPMAVDTSKAAVAQAAIAAGASLINDVTALQGDPKMAGVVARAGVPIILMHMRGTPQTMQTGPVYEDVVHEVHTFLAERLRCAAQAGIDPALTLVDPGIGFGKLLAHNLELLRRLPELTTLDRPIVVGPSRKRFIGEVLDRPVDARVWGTAGAVAVAMTHGAAMVRVHDVAQMQDVVRMVDAICRR